MIRGFFLLYFSIFSTCAFSLDSNDIVKEAIALKKHLDPQWLNALHYKKSFLYGFESQADSQSFFFNPEGKYNNKEEFKSTVKSLLEPVTNDVNNHPQCRFPTRTKVIKRLIPSLANRLSVECPNYKAFIKKTGAKSVSLVFSSYYTSNPSSAFGHTFIVFYRTKAIEENSDFLKNYIVNYAANPTTQNFLLYTILGLSGGFDGVFSFLPYFYKIREYNDFESRDLWEYHLNLTADQVDTIISHIWEMQQTTFDYWYLSENCSYHMLSLLEVANPHWNLTERLPSFVIPTDTIKIVFQTKNLVGDVIFRPSKERVVKNRISKLTKDENKAFAKLISRYKLNDLPKMTSKESKAKVLDSAIDYIDYREPEDVLFKNGKFSRLKRTLLISRSKLGVKTKKIKISLPTNEQPQLGHKSRRIAIGAGRAGLNEDFALVEYRFTLHDLLDNPTGHNKDAWMEMGNFKFRYHPEVEKRGNSSIFRFDEFSLFHVLSLSPLEEYFSTMTWTARVGSKIIKDRGCDFCFAPMMRVGAGFSQDFDWLVYYFMISTEAEVAKDISRRGYRFGTGPDGGIVLRFHDRFQALLRGEYIRRFFSTNKWTYEYSGTLRFQMFHNNSIEAVYTRFEREGEALARYLLYF